MCEVTWVWRFSQTRRLAFLTGGHQSQQLANHVFILHPLWCSFLDFSWSFCTWVIFLLLSAHITAQHFIFQTQAREHRARSNRGNCSEDIGLKGLEFRVKAPLLVLHWQAIPSMRELLAGHGVRGGIFQHYYLQKCGLPQKQDRLLCKLINIV